MKSAFASILLCLTVIGCNNSTESKIKKIVQDEVKRKMKNPDSYKSVEFSKPYVITYRQAYESEISSIERSIKTLNENLELFPDIRNDIINDIQNNEKQVDSFKVLIKNLGNDSTIHHYLVSHKYRGTNSFGGVVTEGVFVTLDSNLVITGYFSDK